VNIFREKEGAEEGREREKGTERERGREGKRAPNQITQICRRRVSVLTGSELLIE
jgi:hypothetical protein